MYEIDPKPNSDQEYCENCEMIVDERMIGITANYENGCSECISRCDICFKFYFAQDMYSCPWFGKICNDCIKDDDYKKDVKDEVLKHSLRCYFDETKNKRVERTIIEVARTMGFDDLAHEMRNDL